MKLPDGLKQFVKDEFDKLSLLLIIILAALLVLVVHRYGDKELTNWATQAFHDAFVAFTAIVTGQIIRGRKDPPNGD